MGLCIFSVLVHVVTCVEHTVCVQEQWECVYLCACWWCEAEGIAGCVLRLRLRPCMVWRCQRATHHSPIMQGGSVLRGCERVASLSGPALHCPTF